MSTKTDYTELEVGLHRVDAENYMVELRFTDPASDVEVSPARGWGAFDLAELLSLQQDPEAYGKALADALFHDESVRNLYARARTATDASGSFLRLRLLVGPSALEMHALRWELLQDPETQAPLATSEKTLLSRFMLSYDWRPVKLRPKSDFKALVAVAAPSDLAKYQLAAIDVEGEVDRATGSLDGIAVEVAGRDQPLTPEYLVSRLRQGVDVLYLVCHGVLERGRMPVLFLQDEAGEVAQAEGEMLARMLAELQEPPRLVVLASCESAGTEQGTTAGGRATAEASIAPRLAEAGVPAIVAMQGKISMKTVEKAMPVFFRELLQDGQIDRAMTVARGTVRDRPDAWMPALFLRIKRGCIWYVPGFGGLEDQFKKWKAIASGVRHGTFIPILGNEVAEGGFGFDRGIAEQMSFRHRFPMAPQDRGDLPRVTQYLSIDQSRKYARDQVLKHLHERLASRHPEIPDARSLSLPKLTDAIVERQPEDDPFRILAELPAPIYVTASPEPLLLKSLRAVGREPVPLVCDWRPSAENHPREPSYDDAPSRDAPVVYHVFGVLGKPSTMVLTEDDFFDYLIATSEYKLIPTAVRGALIRSSLLFLGFRLDHWTFRVLFRLIMNLAGTQRLREFAHVGVQVDPDDSSLLDVERARKYLERYFAAGGASPSISIFWGSAADFLRELRDQLKTAGDEVIVPTGRVDEDEWL